MRARHLLVLLALVAACDASTTTDPGQPDGAAAVGGTGGSTAAGGTTGTGGSDATGGSSATGGSNPPDGATSAGGAAGTGGLSEAGGTTGTGGATGAGGRTGSGRDADVDLGRRLDGAAGGAGGRTDAGPEAGPEVTVDLRADRTADGRPDGAMDARPGSDATTSDGAPCPHAGHVTYTLARSANPTTAEQRSYDLIVPAMDKAVYYYNCYTDITKTLNVSYNSSVQTADGNINGSIRFGGTSYMEYITAMHEIAHTVGVGTASNWRSFVDIPSGGSSGPWTGANANAELRAITGDPTETLTADTQHFWPYGLNYTSEVKSEADVINHCRIVIGLRKDMGLQ